MSSWKRLEVNLDDFDPDKTDYTAAELEAYTDAMLRKDARESRPANVYPRILFEETIASRIRPRERMTGTGETPDPTITNNLSPDGQTMFWRTHPEGRRVNTDKQRKEKRAPFFKN